MTTPLGPSSSTARVLSAEREGHRATFASQGDEAARKRFALPDASSPDYEASLRALEGEIDRELATLDRKDQADDQAKAERQLSESSDDPAPLSDYKRAEAIKQNPGS